MCPRERSVGTRMPANTHVWYNRTCRPLIRIKIRASNVPLRLYVPAGEIVRLAKDQSPAVTSALMAMCTAYTGATDVTVFILLIFVYWLSANLFSFRGICSTRPRCGQCSLEVLGQKAGWTSPPARVPWATACSARWTVGAWEKCWEAF